MGQFVSLNFKILRSGIGLQWLCEGRMLKIKRIYESPQKDDGFRVLVDRLWPRGVSKEKAHLDLWLKEIGPSDALRKWFGHDPKRWTQFAAKYKKELSSHADLVGQMRKIVKDHGDVTLLYSAHDTEHNQAVVLREYLKGARAN
jgi:uncharacterized protein YeaO (DUF488 family)